LAFQGFRGSFFALKEAFDPLITPSPGRYCNSSSDQMHKHGAFTQGKRWR